jgi:hypothetical protein
MKLDPECHTKEECEKMLAVIRKTIDICKGTTVEYDDMHASLKQIYELCEEYDQNKLPRRL